MPVFEYTALNIKGKTVAGIIDAESSTAGRQKLRSSKIFIVSIKEIGDISTKKKPRFFSIVNFFTRIRLSEVSMMTRQLATLLGAGFPLVSAIDTLITQTNSHVFKKALTQIKDSIVGGNSFAGALSPYPEIFSSLYINMVRAGESSGTLEIVLERLADISEKQQTLNNRIKAALAYPILMSLIGILVLFLLLTFIVPSITSIFTDMDQVLPTPTLFLINISDIFKSYWWVIFIFTIAVLATIRYAKKTTKGRYFLDRTLLFLPILGTLVQKIAITRFARTLGSLLENGVTMLSALEIVKNIAGNILISDAIEAAAREVGNGKALGAALSEAKIFPNLFIQMIHVGEQSGELESMLNKIADVFENEAESRIMSMTSLLEPLMILIMGIIVGFIVLSICLPIFEMNQLIM